MYNLCILLAAGFEFKTYMGETVGTEQMRMQFH